MGDGSVKRDALNLEWKSSDESVFKVTGELNTPKTASGNREIVLDSSILNQLLRWKNMQREYLLQLGIEQGLDTPVITNEAGGRMDGNNLARWISWTHERKKARRQAPDLDLRGSPDRVRTGDLRLERAAS